MIRRLHYTSLLAWAWHACIHDMVIIIFNVLVRSSGHGTSMLFWQEWMDRWTRAQTGRLAVASDNQWSWSKFVRARLLVWLVAWWPRTVLFPLIRSTENTSTSSMFLYLLIIRHGFRGEGTNERAKRRCSNLDQKNVAATYIAVFFFIYYYCS